MLAFAKCALIKTLEIVVEAHLTLRELQESQ
jgi:hypothetical protein